MKSILKPCPFCGQLPQITHEKRLISLEFHEGYPNNGRGLYLERDTYNAECTCCALSKSFFSEEEAIAAWNRRQPAETEGTE